ncbi:MAG: alpha-glycosidase, partial [Streptococcaceae bacterium]|nr:alpha-glycosidase [Streptococcaceae bacterium]
NFLLDITTYWIREFDIDAWRLDVANEVDHHFWKKFKSACAKEKKDFYILGEIWHSSQSWLNGDEFDAVMNYAFTDSIIQYLIKKEISLEKMIAELNNQLMSYRTQTNQVMFNVLDSHDTPRIKTVAGENPDLVKQAMTFMYLHQGVPCLYYGTEFGLSGAMDPDCRKCMPWDTKDQDLDMFSFCKNLIRFRRDNQEILSEGKLEWLEVNSENGLIIFSRSLNGQTITGYFNSGQADIPLIIENPQFAGKYDGALLQANGYIVK